MSTPNELAIRIQEFVSSRPHQPTRYDEDGGDFVLSASRYGSWQEVSCGGFLVFDCTRDKICKYVPGAWEDRLKELSRHTIVKKLLG